MDKVNYNFMTSTAFGFNYYSDCVYRDPWLSMIDFPSYVLWHWGNEI